MENAKTRESHAMKLVQKMASTAMDNVTLLILHIYGTAMESVNWSTVWVCKCEMMASGYKLALPRRDVCQAPTAAAAMGESAAASRHSWWSRATTNHYYAALIFIVAESHVPLVNVSRSNQICARRGTATPLWFKECRKGIRSACLEKRLASIINMNTLEKDTFIDNTKVPH